MAEEAQSNVGQILKRRRQRLKLTLTEVELATKIRGKFLTALEAGNYAALPNDIYSRNFVQHYADYLGLDSAILTEQYLKERGGLPQADTQAPRLQGPRRMVVTAHVLAVAVVALVGLALVFYLGYQLASLAGAPHLSITSPGDNQVSTQSTVTVKGTTTPGSDVSIDDVPVSLDANGNFSTSILLQDGVNNLQVVARSKLGKTTRLEHHLLARLPQSAPSPVSAPAATFNGVAVVVSVKSAATSIVVTVDGQDKFRGIFLPGEQMLFQGGSDIKLTTSNAGDTGVVVTNKNVAGKVLDPLGGPGELRNNQDFSADDSFGLPTPAPTPTPPTVSPLATPASQ